MPRSSLLAALAGWLLPLSACQSDAGRYPAVTTGAAQPVVEAVLPLPVHTVRARLLQRLQSTRSVKPRRTRSTGPSLPYSSWPPTSASASTTCFGATTGSTRRMRCR